MLVDRARIFVCSGRGGDGHVSFRREKYVPKGGPDGGNGGDGGSVILVAAEGVDTLLDLAGHHHWRADSGRPGAPKQCDGAGAPDLEVRVPPGTLIYDDETGQLLVDLDEPGRCLIAAKGGRGGFGNLHFKSATDQAPRRFTAGGSAEQRMLRLELKLIADVGLVGMPNAGKSTILSAVSAARPKIADYPFTTLEPHLGIVELSGSDLDSRRRLVMADIPGLIEGAAQGQGLGMGFLRHVERTRLLLHVIDILPLDGSDPTENYRTIRRELKRYSRVLANKPQIIVLNKVDLLPAELDRTSVVKKVQQIIAAPARPISAATGLGLRQMVEECWKLVKGVTDG